MKPIKEILLMKYLNPYTEEVEGVDIVAFIGASSELLASVRHYDEASEMISELNVPIRTDEDYVQMHGDTPVFNLFKSVLLEDYAVA